jgi:chromosome segregation ATPase
MLNHNGTGNASLEDLCGCQDLACKDCAADAARVGAVSEGSAVDGETSAPTTPVACTPYLPPTLVLAHLEIASLDRHVVTLRKHIAQRDALIGSKVAYMTQLELAHVDDHKRIENLTLTVRELEALVIKRDAELTEKRSLLTYVSNMHFDAVARADSLQTSIETLEGRIRGYERDMSGTVKELEDARDSNARKAEHVAELQSSLVMMTEMASEAAKDADKYMNDGAELSQLLHDSGKREDRAHETLMGIRALAESDSLTDAEKVALILRLA